MKYSILILSALFCSPAAAEDCNSLPPGPQRFACASAHHPAAAEKRERCKHEAEGMGLQPSHNTNGQAFKSYVSSCMQRR
jgi:hypothetical protein